MKSAIGLAVSRPIADAPGEPSKVGAAGSEVVVAAAGLTVLECAPNSRRPNASAAHAHGSASGLPPPPPTPDQLNRALLKPDTEPVVAGAAIITGAVASDAAVEAPITGTAADGRGAISAELGLTLTTGTVKTGTEAALGGVTKAVGAETLSLGSAMFGSAATTGVRAAVGGVREPRRDLLKASTVDTGSTISVLRAAAGGESEVDADFGAAVVGSETVDLDLPPARVAPERAEDLEVPGAELPEEFPSADPVDPAEPDMSA